MLKFRSMVSLAALGAALAACSAPVEDSAEGPPSRAGLAPGIFDAESVIWNLEMTASVPPPDGFFDRETAMIPLSLPAVSADEATAALDEAPVDEADIDAEGDAEAETDAEPAEDEDTGPGLLAFANSDLGILIDSLQRLGQVKRVFASRSAPCCDCGKGGIGRFPECQDLAKLNGRDRFGRCCKALFLQLAHKHSCVLKAVDPPCLAVIGYAVQKGQERMARARFRACNRLGHLYCTASDFLSSLDAYMVPQGRE